MTEANRKQSDSPGFLVDDAVLRVKCPEDAIFAVTAAGVEVQRRHGPFVPKDSLHHVDRYTVVHQPGGVAVPKIMKTQGRIKTSP